MILHRLRPMFERLAYFCHLALLVGCIGATWLGAITGLATGNFGPMLAAVGGLGVSGWLHAFGNAHWHFRECEASLAIRDAAGLWPRSDEESACAAELTTLFMSLEHEPDVWRRGELRREISRRLQAAPTLRDEFTTELARRPDI